MGTTTNNSWPYPESSDYVADGATAIENLADAIDTSIGDVADLYGGKLLAAGTIGSDVSLSTSITTIDTISFTLSRNTFVGIGFYTGEVDSFSNNPMYVYLEVTDSATSTYQYASRLIDRGQGWGTIYGNSALTYHPLTTGSYSLDLIGVTSTGTARLDNSSSLARNTSLFAINLGGF